MDPNEAARRFLEHYRNRGATFRPGPAGRDGLLFVRSPSGPAFPMTVRRFRGRVLGFLDDSATPASPEQADAVTRAALGLVARQEGERRE